MRTINDIMRLSSEERRTEYQAVDIGKVYINNIPFDNYGEYSFIWEKSYVKSPERSSDGSIGNLNSYATFITPHLKIDFSMMSIDYYRQLMKLIYSQNEFVVRCYDVVYNKIITCKMYFTTEEMPKLWTIANKMQKGADEWEEWVDLVGVQGYTVEMVGTNSPVDLISVRYYANYPNANNSPDIDDTLHENGDDITLGEEFVIGQGISYPTQTPPVGYRFVGWGEKADTKITEVIQNGTVFTATQGLVDENSQTINFYAIWETSNKSILGFNYGLATPKFSSEVADIETYYSREVQQGISIGILPEFNLPSVKYQGKNDSKKEDYFPYINGKWYKSPVKGEVVNNNTPYWRAADTTIYLLFDIEKYYVYYVTNQSDFTISPQKIEYGATVFMPNLAKQGWTFNGWYLDSGFTKTLQGTTMPPEDITLYAKWTK